MLLLLLINHVVRVDDNFRRAIFQVCLSSNWSNSEQIYYQAFIVSPLDSIQTAASTHVRPSANPYQALNSHFTTLATGGPSTRLRMTICDARYGFRTDNTNKSPNGDRRWLHISKAIQQNDGTSQRTTTRRRRLPRYHFRQRGHTPSWTTDERWQILARHGKSWA